MVWDFVALELDVAVVAAYGLILPQSMLDAPRHGCLNVHASLLPRWRGAAPIQRALLAGDAETVSRSYADGARLTPDRCCCAGGANHRAGHAAVMRVLAGGCTTDLARAGRPPSAVPQTAEGDTHRKLTRDGAGSTDRQRGATAKCAHSIRGRGRSRRCGAVLKVLAV